MLILNITIHNSDITSDVSYIVLIFWLLPGILVFLPSLDMDFLEPLGDKDLMRNPGVGTGISTWNILLGNFHFTLLGISSFPNLFCCQGKNRNICPFLGYGIICCDQ